MPRCGHVSRMAKYFPAAVRPSTSGMPSSMAVAMRLPPTSDERSAGYQSSYSKLAVGPEAATCARVTSPIMGVKLHTIAEPYWRLALACGSQFRCLLFAFRFSPEPNMSYLGDGLAAFDSLILPSRPRTLLLPSPSSRPRASARVKGPTFFGKADE